MYQKCVDADILASASAGVNQSHTHIHFVRNLGVAASHDRDVGWASMLLKQVAAVKCKKNKRRDFSKKNRN